ncbi:GlpG protein [Sinobacterium caligoides]|uniref:GlpG protein n=1 Tax=Sinobacterium caligoides TaxID=933926 RepID=A0A3N2DNF6_9GAMM|nr:rhomboid family intramembrane serine protease [Sinobacterium caligoides]ROS01310.1 GlpG protein [Sinobacterium caligoides]
MAEIRALTLSLEEDIGALSRLLHSRGLAHWITEEAGRQVVYVQDQQHVEVVEQYYQAFQRGELTEAAARQPAAPRRQLNWRVMFTAVPVTLVTIILSILGALLVYLDPGQSHLHWLTFQDFFYDGRRLFFQPVTDSWLSGEYWRLLTPTFLHFGILHITFNVVWMWFFGHRIELLQGRSQLLILVMATALGANIAQYLMAPDTIFGGLSGVDAGLVGYVWVWSLLRKGEDFTVPSSLIYMMVAYLVIAATGVVTLFSGTSVANAAHFGGLFSGMAVALLSAMLRVRYSGDRVTG